jgi:hypothetical protein
MVIVVRLLLAVLGIVAVFQVGHFFGATHVRQEMYTRCQEAHIPALTCYQYVSEL